MESHALLVRVAAALASFAMALGGASAATAPPKYRVVELGQPAGNVVPYWATDINNNGQVVGFTNSPDGSLPFIWSAGTFQLLQPLPGFSGGAAYGLNDLGQVVGTSFKAGTNVATMWSGSSVVNLAAIGAPVMGGGGSVARAINNDGLVVGDIGYGGGAGFTLPLQTGVAGLIWTGQNRMITPYAVNDAGVIVGYGGSATGGNSNAALISKNGVVSDLGGTQPARNDMALGLNDNGTVVGYALLASNGNTAAAAWRNGQLQGLWGASNDSSEATDVNNHEWVVGRAGGTGILYLDGAAHDLDSLITPSDPLYGQIHVGIANAINDDNWIVGTAAIGGQWRAVLLVPVPEAGTAPMLLLGGLLIAMALRWNRARGGKDRE